MPCAWRSTSRSPVWVMFCVVAPQCTQPPCGSPTIRLSSQTSGHDGVAGAGEPLVDAGAVHQRKMRLLRNRRRRCRRDDAELSLGLGQRGLDVEPCLPAVFQLIESADAGVSDAGGGREGVAHERLDLFLSATLADHPKVGNPGPGHFGGERSVREARGLSGPPPEQYLEYADQHGGHGDRLAGLAQRVAPHRRRLDLGKPRRGAEGNDEEYEGEEQIEAGKNQCDVLGQQVVRNQYQAAMWPNPSAPSSSVNAMLPITTRIAVRLRCSPIRNCSASSAMRRRRSGCTVSDLSARAGTQRRQQCRSAASGWLRTAPASASPRPAPRPLRPAPRRSTRSAASPIAGVTRSRIKRFHLLTQAGDLGHGILCPSHGVPGGVWHGNCPLTSAVPGRCDRAHRSRSSNHSWQEKLH